LSLSAEPLFSADMGDSRNERKHKDYRDMAIKPEDRKKIVEEFRKNEKDTGSAELQVALLTKDIKELTEHLKVHKKDFHSRRGLLQKVGLRNRLLRYLKRKDFTTYKSLCDRLGLRH